MVTLLFNAKPEDCVRLGIGLAHCNTLVVGGGHYGVNCILGEEPVNYGNLHGDCISAMPCLRVQGAREGSYGST